MVNSGSFDSDGQGDRNAKAGFTQPHSAPDGAQSSSPVTASAATSCNAGFSQTADSGHAIGPTPTKTEFNSDMPVENFTNLEAEGGEKASLCCSLPLEKIQGVLTSYHPPLARPDDDGARTAKQPARKLLCLYCDRSFVSANLRQKHVERIHSVKPNRRVSSRRQNQLTVTPCVYCDRLNGTENTLKDLFQHLVNEHSSKYFGCLPCEDRFLTPSLLADHNVTNHQSDTSQTVAILDTSTNLDKTTLKSPVMEKSKADATEEVEEIPVKITRSKMKPKPEDDKTKKPSTSSKKKSTKLKELRSKKLSVKSSRIAMKRRESKRLQAIAKIPDTQKKKRPKPVEKKNSNSGKTEQTNSTKSTEKIKTNPTCINPYPEFDHFYRVKKITDHSIDNLKISSLTFDDVFDKAFFNRIRCNIEENLLHHIDGKLFKNEESESRISNFEKVSNAPQEVQNSNSENYGCELSLNAVTPVAALSLNSQFGEDFESQIEYGSKPSKKKTQPRKDEIHYKYFTRRKYQASILEHKENRDLSKLDMWTQLVIKRRQQKMLDDKKSAKEMLEYASCDEYKNKLKREELNRILDRRGPFEDLKEEASKKAALDKLNSASEDGISEETFTEVREVLNEILNRVFAATDDLNITIEANAEKVSVSGGRKEDLREIPGYLNLRRASSLPSDGEIDRSDKISLICSSQETENFELPTNQVRGKNELIELTGEWARCRMYICAACGAKLPNMKYLLDHKSMYHQNVWVQHYEFVGNQSELYRHLSIPSLGKVGAVEDSVQCKVWKRSDARLCTKCGKQCNSLGELHRHILECGGDWTWMLARKKCKYRPFGAKSRRKRRGLINRSNHKQKTEPAEKKTYKKTFEGPRQRPSDADTIQRMLANLPAKRSTRKLISLHDGIYRARKTTQNIKQNKVKCGKVIYKSSTRNETTEKTINTTPTITKSQINSSSNRRSLRNLNKVLASRILDTNSNLNMKRKIKVLNERRRTRQSLLEQENVSKDIVNDENLEQSSSIDTDSLSKSKTKTSKVQHLEFEGTESSAKRNSPRSSPKNLKKKISVKKLLTGKINIKSFFPVKKKKNRNILTENQNPQGPETTEDENSKTRSKRKLKETPVEEDVKKNEIAVINKDQKKPKHETFSTLMRSLSLRKKKPTKKAVTEKNTKITENNTNIKQQNPEPKTVEESKQIDQNGELDKTAKKRKLKNSFRNVISKVKKMKIDTDSEKTAKTETCQKNHKEGAFLEESNLEGPSLPVQVEKVVIPSISEAKENSTDLPKAAPTIIDFHDSNENPPIPETIFKLELNNEKSLQAKGELDFDTQPINKTNDSSTEKSIETETTIKEIDTVIEDTNKTQPISIETSVKPKIVPLISPNMKGKIRKPTRGLNDCIAMLTSKLQQKTTEENSIKTNNVFSLLTPSKPPPPLQESYPKTECILRIPTYKSQIPYPEIEETALDLSTKSLRNQELPEREEPFRKSLFAHNNPVFLNNAQPYTKNFISSAFNQKLNKPFNSVDRIIEDVVENRIQTIFPVIHQKKYNSMEDIIQKVIDEQRSVLKLPIRNSVDDIIDFVVENGNSANSNYNVNQASIVQNLDSNKEMVRKLGSIRKPRVRKSSTEILRSEQAIGNPVMPLIASFSHQLLENSLFKPFIDTGIESPNAIIAKCESVKKKSKSRKHKQDIASIEVIKTPTLPYIARSIHEIQEIAEMNRIESELNSAYKEFRNNQTNSEILNQHLNDAFIATICKVPVVAKNSAKTKKSSRKVGQARNRSRVKKVEEIKTVEPEKIFIETNIDTLLDTKEIESSPVLECSRNVSISTESPLTKSDEMKQLSNEDEPLLLENKPMSLQQKPNSLASDSEDDIPLAALIKCDGKVAKTVELKSNNESTSKAPDEKTIEVQSMITDIKQLGPELNNKNKIELTDDPDVGKAEKLTADQSSSCIQMQEPQKAIKTAENSHSLIQSSQVLALENLKRGIENVVDENTELPIGVIANLVDSPHSPTLLKSESSGKLTADVINNSNSNTSLKNLKPRDEDSLTSSSATEDNPLSGPLINILQEQLLPLDIEPAESNKTDLSSSISNQIEGKIITSVESTENLKSSSEIKEIKLDTPKSNATTAFDNNHSFLENTNKVTKHFSDKFQTKSNGVSNNSKSKTQIKTNFDHSAPSSLNEVVLSSINSLINTEKLTVQLKPLVESNEHFSNLYFGVQTSKDQIVNIISPKENIEEDKSETDQSNEISKEESETLKCKEKLNTVDADEMKMKKNEDEASLCLGNKVEMKPIFTELNPNEFAPKAKKKVPKSKVKSRTTKTKKSSDSEISSKVFDEVTNGLGDIIELENKMLDEKLLLERNQRALLEDDIPLKILQQEICDDIAMLNKTLNESKYIDSEIENIFSSSQSEPKTRVRSSTNKKGKNELKTVISSKKLNANNTVSNEDSVRDKDESIPQKAKEKLVQSKEVVTDDFTGEALRKTTEVSDIKEIKIKGADDALNINSELYVSLKRTTKEIKQLKNLEVSLKLTDFRKTVFSHSNSEKCVTNEDNKSTKSGIGLVVLETKMEKKLQVNHVDTFTQNNSLLKSNSDSDSDERNHRKENETETISNSTNFETDGSKFITDKSQYRQDNSANTEIPEELTRNNKSTISLEKEESLCTKEEENEILISSDEDPNVKEAKTENNKDIETKVQLEQLSNDISVPVNVDSKIKRKKRHTKTSKKTKSKGEKTAQTNKEFKTNVSNTVEKAAIVTTFDHVETTNLSTANKETSNKTVDVPLESQMKENSNENLSGTVSEEPPIKIVINKQKTRRKSKSFKKVDLKGQNDLFEDFALVIKKPKRVASIIAFTPLDTFSKDTYPNYMKKPLEEPLSDSKVVIDSDEADGSPIELDSSVEEMDMELDEIPITSNIIERNTKNFIPSVADTFTKTDVATFVETLNTLENEKRIQKEEGSKFENNTKDISIQDLFLSPEEDLILPMESKIEEFLNESQAISNEDKNTDKHDICPKNKNINDSQEAPENLAKFDFNFVEEHISEDFGDKSISNLIEDPLKDLDIHIKPKKPSTKKTKKCKNKNAKSKDPHSTTESVDMKTELNISLLEVSPILKNNKITNSKRKRSKSMTVSSVEKPQIDFSINGLAKESDKVKDVESIYAFSESEDFEIGKPLEKSNRSQRKQKSLSESADVQSDNLIVDLVPVFNGEITTKQPQKDTELDIEVISTLCVSKNKSKSNNSIFESKVIGEIKENDVDIQEERRKSVRSAKVKALEHIHDDALAELTESERNRGPQKDKHTTESFTSREEFSKRTNRKQSRSQKAQILNDSVLANNTANTEQLLDLQENTPSLNATTDESCKKIADKTGEEKLVTCLDKEPNLNGITENIEDNLNLSAKKKSSKKVNKSEKAKKPLDIFQIAAEDTEKSLLLKDIASDLTGLEELENSIERELNADLEGKKASRQLRVKTSDVEETENIDLLTEENNQELRRSRRGSRKIASYNENDLIDPLLDEIDNKKKIRKKEKAVIEELESRNHKKLKVPEKKLNSEQLFDLLKASSNEISNQKLPLTNSQHNFHVFEGVLDDCPSLLKQSSDKSKEGRNVDSIYEFTDSPETAEQLKSDSLSLEVKRKPNKKVPRSTQSSKHQAEENSSSVSIITPVSESRTAVSSSLDIFELNDSKTKSIKNVKTQSTDKLIYCEICNKKFTRTESLAKHKRTLTHIQKLSEIEAKEAAQKSQSQQNSNSVIEITSDSSKVTENLSKSDINIHDILQESDKPNRQDLVTDHTTFPNNHSLKLADIINDVLNKPVLESTNDKRNSFSDIIMQNNAYIQPEYRRYKSLGERKSFDSEPIESEPVPISTPFESKTTILEKQISLLENIIENQTGVNYIDDISMSSNNSLDNNDALVSPSELSLKQDDSNTYSRINLTKPNTNDDSFLKPSQYEEISEDSVNLRSYEDQKLRKTLNRDEELFLECCSLLKSGSEMSSYSNKKSQNKVLHTMGLKQCDEPEWLERKSLVEKPLYDVGNEYSDNSRIPTPLGDSYDDDASYSNTITSNWNMNKVNVFEDISQDKEDDLNKSFSFQEVLDEEEKKVKLKSGISKFGGILSKTIGALPKVIKRTPTVLDGYTEELPAKKQEELSDGLTNESKKIITKGARKVFEGLKVSIPTEELNLEEVLNVSPKSKKIEIAHIQNSVENEKLEASPKPTRTARKSKPVKNKSQFGSNLLFKMKKKKVASPGGAKNKNDEVKSHDIYDFEETQDNTDVFTKPDFRAFRNMKSSEALPEPESDTDSRDCIDSFSYEAPSITSSISSSSSKKPKAQENITKKKCMIMGRIFKNAAKSKIEDIDEEIRDIPTLDNCELLESYVADCKKIIKNEEVAKPKLSEKEINQLFDQLLEDRFSNQDPKNSEVKTSVKPKTDVKKTDSKKKPKPKNKKRTRTNSDSTDDEFSLNKSSKKRAYRKNAKAEDNCINLEQELKECIGVASRKSQRKCTSGKQNVLVEYWSSDDSQFEALLESQRIEVKQPNTTAEVVIITEPEPEVPEFVDPTPAPLKSIEIDTLEKKKPKNTEKKPQPKRKPSSEKKLKPTTPNMEKISDSMVSNRRKRAAVNPLYHWSSSSEDESQDLIEVKPIRDELEDDEDRPVQHGWIVGDSPKKLVTMLAQAKGKKTDIDSVKEQGKKRANAVS